MIHEIDSYRLLRQLGFDHDEGQGLELEAIAAAVIGGTSMMGGVGSIFGSFLGALIMAHVRTGLVLMGTDAYVQDALVGLVIALAVIINVQLSKGFSNKKLNQ